MRKNRISMSDLVDRIKNYTYPHGTTIGKVTIKERVMGADLEIHYLFEFPQGIARENTQYSYPYKNEEGKIERGVAILKDKLTDPDLEISYLKKDKESANIEIKRKRKESSLEEKTKENLKTEEISEDVFELYEISDSDKIFYKHLMKIDSSPFSLACLSQTRIDEENGIVYVSNEFIRKKIVERYGRKINKEFGQVARYIIDPTLKNKRLHISLREI